MPSRMTIYRAKREPLKTKSLTLYELAEEQRCPMEFLLGKPLFFVGTKIDGVVEQNGEFFAFDFNVPKRTPKNALFVYHTNDEFFVSRKNKNGKIENIIGIVVLRMSKTPTSTERIY